MTECVPCRQHMSVMREWHRERKVNSTRELAYHSPITIYRVQTACSETGSLACSGWMVPNHLTIFQPLCPAAVTTSVVSFTPTSSPLPPHLLWQCWLPHYSHNPLPFDYTGSNHTTPTGVWENVWCKKMKNLFKSKQPYLCNFRVSLGRKDSLNVVIWK